MTKTSGVADGSCNVVVDCFKTNNCSKQFDFDFSLSNIARSKTQVTFHRSLVAGHCFTFLKATQNPQFGLILGL